MSNVPKVGETLVSELMAAEDYRQQRQRVDARKNGFEPISETVDEWFARNEGLLREIVVSNGAPISDVDNILAQYKLSLQTASGSEFDDPNVQLILKGVIDKIEEVCRAGEVPIRGGVVYGVSPELGAVICQATVVSTDVSIIKVSLPFIAFCNGIAKAMARTLPISADRSISNDPRVVKEHLTNNRALAAEWAHLIVSYAISGWPPSRRSPTPEGRTQITRLLILQSLEWFAVAHEYGHHILRHGVVQASDQQEDPILQEHEADIFARAVSMVLGSREAPPNAFAWFGAGGVLILGMLELVRRARELLKTGVDRVPVLETHPPFLERISTIAALDANMPSDYAMAAADMRECFAGIISIIWDEVSPVLVELHASGMKPLDLDSDLDGWLPL